MAIHLSPRQPLSLRTCVAGALVGSVVVVAATVGLSAYFLARDLVTTSTIALLEDMAMVTASHTGVHILENDADTEANQSGETDRLLDQLLISRPQIRGVCLYSIAEGGRVALIGHALADQDLMPIAESGGRRRALRACLVRPYAPHAEPQTRTRGPRGNYAAFAPVIARDGGVRAVVGLYYSADRALERWPLFVLTIALTGAGVCLLAVAASFRLSLRIARPLERLQKSMERLHDMNLDDEATVGSGITEVVRMREIVEDMRSALRSFRKYVPPDLVAHHVQSHKVADLGSEKRVITVFFSDIANFARLSEQLGPEELTEALGVYFEGMTRSILEEDGTVDKYVGDSVMAFWGAPASLQDHAVRACRAALKCQRYQYGVSREWERKGFPNLHTRIGLNTGEVVVGNVGYRERMNYTIVGDNVNLTDRVQELNKYYGTDILMTEPTHLLAREHMETRLVDIVVVKGRTQQVPIYELMGEKGTLSDDWVEFLRKFAKAIDLYREREWDDAVDTFAALAEEQPNDRPTRIHLDRCRRFQKAPPPAKWQGAVFMRDK